MERGGLVIDVSNVDPGTGPERRLSPAVFTIPPSWKPSAQVLVRASDPGISGRLLRGGVDVRVIQEILGHARLDTTKVYLRLVPARGLRSGDAAD